MHVFKICLNFVCFRCFPAVKNLNLLSGKIYAMLLGKRSLPCVGGGVPPALITRVTPGETLPIVVDVEKKNVKCKCFT